MSIGSIQSEADLARFIEQRTASDPRIRQLQGLVAGLTDRVVVPPGPPATLRDGDAWVEAGLFKVRIGGVTRTVTIT